MIINTMTFEEIADELNRDYMDEIDRKLYSIEKNSLYRRTILKSQKHGLINFKPITFKSKRGNTIILTPYVASRSLYKKTHELQFSIIATFYYRRTHFVAWLTSDAIDLKPSVYFYPSHLFERYGERFLKENFIMNTENFSCFFLKNRAVSFFANCPHPKYKNHLFATINDGVLFGETIDRHVQFFKTYITFDMLKGMQVDSSNFLRPQIQEILDAAEERLKVFSKKSRYAA